ncbi:MAG TPA: hypothetical protein PLO24_09915 [Bacteroidales bacterium]|jgi:hypothetical protein|nr:hypothetical protein [Bacteroidales bacterium]HOS71700.1 hypothetical protein [Bacteroidales bacterium]HQH25282.1 hypothetical protein [Bacteroidales bacterium]HQJ83498.1 hypothetical protein [Bacteroidales bacterium]
MYSDKWISVKSIIENQDVSEVEIKERSYAKQIIIFEEYNRKIEEARKRKEKETALDCKSIYRIPDRYR